MEANKAIFIRVTQSTREAGFTITDHDFERPWGGFLVIEESQSKSFIEQFFPEERSETLAIVGKLSPKILMVAPGKRLSWQYHFRRAEIWRCVEGPVAVATSQTDEEKERRILKPGDLVRLPQGIRHRLIGLDSWGIVVEIWQHTELNTPSDENDIVRLQDDFGR